MASRLSSRSQHTDRQTVKRSKLDSSNLMLEHTHNWISHYRVRASLIRQKKSRRSMVSVRCVRWHLKQWTG
nr:MAG TPA: hypothetical protein [Caudoviricetes sp.]